MLNKLFSKLLLIHKHIKYQHSQLRMEPITAKNITYLDQVTAQKFDEELMNNLGHPLEVLMELAGNIDRIFLSWRT